MLVLNSYLPDKKKRPNIKSEHSANITQQNSCRVPAQLYAAVNAEMRKLIEENHVEKNGELKEHG